MKTLISVVAIILLIAGGLTLGGSFLVSAGYFAYTLAPALFWSSFWLWLKMVVGGGVVWAAGYICAYAVSK